MWNGTDGLPARPAAPGGGFYLFPDFEPAREALRVRGIATSAQMCGRLLDETGVALLPGSDFGRPPEELTARLAYVDFDGAKALAAVETKPRDARLEVTSVETYAPRVLRAVDRIAEWLRRPVTRRRT